MDEFDKLGHKTEDKLEEPSEQVNISCEMDKEKLITCSLDDKSQESPEHEPKSLAKDNTNLINNNAEERTEEPQRYANIQFTLDNVKRVVYGTGEKIKDTYECIRRSPATAEVKHILIKTGTKLKEASIIAGKCTLKASRKVEENCDAKLMSMIIGIIMSIACGVVLFACIGWLVYVNVGTALGQRSYSATSIGFYISYDMRQSTDLTYQELANILIMNSVIVLGMILFLLEFCFAAILAYGSSKGVPDNMYAYFVYGNIKTGLLFITTMVVYIIKWEAEPGCYVLMATVLNQALTMMVYMGYRKVVKARIQHDFDEEDQLNKSTQSAPEKVNVRFDATMGSMVVGCFLAVMSGIALLACVSALVYQILITTLGRRLDGVEREYKDSEHFKTVPSYEITTILAINCTTIAALIYFMTDFAFSLLLAVGASKRNVDAMKIYLVYGVLKSLVTLVVCLALFVVVCYMVPLFGLLSCCINIMVLVMVCVACKQLTSQSRSFSKFVNEVIVQG